MSHAIRLSRLAAIAACLFVITAAVSACGSSSSKSSTSSASSSTSATSTAATGTPKPGGSMTVLELGGYAGAWPAGLDPATNVNGAADQDQMNSIFGQLFQLAAGGKVVPDLAASATPSAGGKTWTITLQPNLKFSDGTPLNGQAVVANWTRDLANPCTCKPVLPPVKSITAPNATTVVLSLGAPDGAFQNQLLVANLNWIASPAALKSMGEQAFKIKPVGAGPFTVVSDTLSSTLVLKKNPSYWQTGRPYLDNLTFKATADDEAALEALQSGGAQAYDGMATPSLVSTYKSHFTTTEQPATSPYDIQLNTAAPPFNNVNARLAIYYATDAAIIDQKLFGNQFQVVQGFTAPGGLFYYPNVPGYPTYDLSQGQVARQAAGRAERELLHPRLTGEPELHGGAPEPVEAGGNQHLDPPVQPGRADPAVRLQEVAGRAPDRGGMGSGRGSGSRIPVPVRLAVQRRARPEARRTDSRRRRRRSIRRPATRPISRLPSTSPRMPTGRSCSRSPAGTSPCTACRGRDSPRRSRRWWSTPRRCGRTSHSPSNNDRGAGIAPDE